jgi:hypothetical protein
VSNPRLGHATGADPQLLDRDLEHLAGARTANLDGPMSACRVELLITLGKTSCSRCQPS